MQDAFIADFITKTPILQQYVTRLQKWRDRYETMLDRKSRKQNLESSSHWLIEFQYHKFDDIEVPGQYITLADSSQTFVRIGFFSPKYDFFRQATGPVRRLTIVGHDGSQHPFAVQSPAVRHCRREERVMQLFRLLNECVVMIAFTHGLIMLLGHYRASVRHEHETSLSECQSLCLWPHMFDCLNLIRPTSHCKRSTTSIARTMTWAKTTQSSALWKACEP